MMRRAHRTTRAFSVVEMLVTIGIFVLVAVGAATIFNSITGTLSAGKKVAEMNRFAARLERIMREDFESMTREGFLVIVNQHAPGRDPGNDSNVQLWPGERADSDDDGFVGRRRRVDEIMFFTEGEYETARRSVSTGLIARAQHAAVYYGHGQRRRFDSNRDVDDPMNKLFYEPSPYDTNVDLDEPRNALLGVEPDDGIANPNQYASDWTLLRQVTLMTPPERAGQELPESVYGVDRVGDDRDWLEDTGRQVALQPAARSIFNSLSQTRGQSSDFVAPRWYREYRPGLFFSPEPIAPFFRASGVVDIVTQDLETMNTTLYGLSATEMPSDYWDRGTITDPPPILLSDAADARSYDDFSERYFDPATTPNPADIANHDFRLISSATEDRHQNIRLWMIDALPSLWDLSATDNPIPVSRVRYEPVPPRLIYDEDEFPDNDDGDRRRSYEQAHQEMLGSSVFIPRCTEFVVEWSYGLPDENITDTGDPRYKRMLWYGLDRWIDADGDGVIESDGEENQFIPGEDHRVALPYRRPTQFDTGPERSAHETLLIVGRPNLFGGFGNVPEPEIAAFGKPDARGRDWAWPKFIRVTMSIADPDDLSNEQTYQMVFQVPERDD